MLKLIKDDIFIWKGLSKNQIEKTIYLIERSPSNSFDNISGTDWNLEIDKKVYWQFLSKECLPKFKEEFCKRFNCPKMVVDNFWYQEYKKGDFHQKHIHSNCHFANVLFLKNCEINPTSILNYDIPKKYIVPGNILSFPAYRIHESKKHTSKKNKLIVSFNTNLINTLPSKPREIKYET